MHTRDMPHAAMNMLMQWARLQGVQVIGLQYWSEGKGWSTLPEWFVHLKLCGTPCLHVRIKPRGYRFVINVEPNPSSCKGCATYRRVDQAEQEQAIQTALPAPGIPTNSAFVCD
jgi:hypothetical protein